MNLIRRFLPKEYKISYSQCGEDLIVEGILRGLKISRPAYLDIGAHHPTSLSNTCLLYKQGHHGVCVEPDPFLFREIKKKRKRDVCLNVGVAGEKKGSSVDFYIMTDRVLNTFVKEEAERLQNYGKNRIEKVVKIPIVSVNELIGKYFAPCPNFVSLDVEGMDYEILKTFDFTRYRPEVFCVETLTYTEDKSEKKIKEIIEFMPDNGYFLYADTFINSIFVDEKAWKSR